MSKASKTPISILLVEDNLNDQELIINKLNKSEKFSISTTIANNLEWALKWLDKAQFDIVLLDLKLPDSINSEHTIRAIREKTNIKVLIITGVLMNNTLVKENNIQGFMSKNDLVKENSHITLDKLLDYTLATNTIKESRSNIQIVTNNLNKAINKCIENNTEK